MNLTFGAKATNIVIYVKFGLRIDLKCLNDHKDTRIQIKSNRKIQELASHFKSHFPDLDNVWCIMDGMKSTIQSAKYIETQRMFYNSWQLGHYVTHVFVFAADGTFSTCLLNLPGSTHASTVAVY